MSTIDTLGKASLVDFERYKGYKFLLVNVDIYDSTYKQFSDLVALSARISGCKVVVFPAENSPTLAADLYKAFPNAFASKNLIVVHPQPVSGMNASQVYKWLANKTANSDLSVNCDKPFYKILISREGTLEAVFGPAMKVTDTYILQAINK
jgi:glutathione peroxidase-family protein